MPLRAAAWYLAALLLAASLAPASSAAPADMRFAPGLVVTNQGPQTECAVHAPYGEPGTAVSLDECTAACMSAFKKERGACLAVMWGGGGELCRLCSDASELEDSEGLSNWQKWQIVNMCPGVTKVQKFGQGAEWGTLSTANPPENCGVCTKDSGYAMRYNTTVIQRHFDELNPSMELSPTLSPDVRTYGPCALTPEVFYNPANTIIPLFTIPPLLWACFCRKPPTKAPEIPVVALATGATDLNSA